MAVRRSAGIIAVFLLLFLGLFFAPVPAHAALVSVTINSPANNTNTSVTTPAINFTIIDNNQTTINYTVFLGDGTGSNFVNVTGTGNQANNNTPTVYTFSALPNGTVTVYVQAINSTGVTKNSSYLTLTIDDTPPSSVNIISPQNGASLTNSTPLFIVNATDNVFANGLNFSIFNDSGSMLGSALGANSTNINFSISALSNGTTEVFLRVRDPAGNEANSSRINLTINYVLSSASIISPVSGADLSSTTPQFTLYAGDTISTSSMNFSLFKSSGQLLNSTIGLSNVNVMLNSSALSDGTTEVYFMATDPAGNQMNSSRINITIDDTAPVVSVISPANNSVFNGSAVNVTFNVTDNVFNSSISYTVFADSSAVASGTAQNNSNTTVIAALAAGNHSIYVNAADPAGNSRNSSLVYVNVTYGLVADTASQTILVGNISQTYNMSVNVTVNQSNVPLNVTFIVPYGIVNQTSCDTGFVQYNSTYMMCMKGLGAIVNGSTLRANFTFSANLSAFTTYGYQAFVVLANYTGKNFTQNTTVTFTGSTYPRNPRPDAYAPSPQNSTLVFQSWGQTDPFYNVLVPLLTFNGSTNGLFMLNGTFISPVFYSNQTIFQYPSYQKVFTYNLTFKLNVSDANAAFIIRSPINTTLDMNQLLVPVLVNNATAYSDPNTNNVVVYNATTANPVQTPTDAFTVYVNGTAYTSAQLAAQGLNITFMNNTDQSLGFLNVTANQTFANSQVSVLVTLSNSTLCGPTCETSPVFVNLQQMTGWTVSNPMPLDSQTAMTYFLNVTNALANYTLCNLSLSMQLPVNYVAVGPTNENRNNLVSSVTALGGVSTANAATGVFSLPAVTGYSYQFNATEGTLAGENVTMNMSSWDVQLSNGTTALLSWQPGNFANISFSAILLYPWIINEQKYVSTAAGSHDSYNTSFLMLQRGPLNLTGKVSGYDTSTTPSVMLDGVSLSTSNLTLQNLIINDVSAGVHWINITYTVPTPAASSGTPSSGSGSGSLGGGLTSTPGTASIHVFLLSAGTRVLDASLDGNDTALRRLQFLLGSDKTNVQFDIAMTSSRPFAAASAPGADLVYGYITITLTNVTDSDISSASVDFSVNSSWITSNGLDKNSISLYRYSGGAWTKLVTTLLTDEGLNVVYRATSPGLSIFAVGAASTTPASNQSAQAPPAGAQNTTQNATSGSQTAQTLGNDTLNQTINRITNSAIGAGVDSILVVAIGAIIVVVAAGLGYYFFLKNRKEGGRKDGEERKESRHGKLFSKLKRKKKE